jgi:uncharacterized oxidoreductase
MPILHADQLQSVAERILEAAGVSRADAVVVATELKDANLVGHDSHGVMRLVQYVDYVRQGFIKPDAKVELCSDERAWAVFDGHFHFGQVTATRALSWAMDKAREIGTATVWATNCNHVGRLGSYAQKAALAGFATLMVVNSPGPGGVAPFGGIERRVGTNPIAMSAPRGDRPLVLDMTSSATAEGKVRVALQKGVPVPEGMIIDSQGNPTTDPADLYGPPEGAILPLGGVLGFKGFGLSVMVDVFGGMLSRSGVCRDDLPRGANGLWMYLVDVDKVACRADFDSLLERYVAHVKSSKRLPGVDEILMPGEIELRRQAERECDGVDVPAETWRQIRELATSLGVSLD